MIEQPSVIGFDTETHLISELQIIPRLVCATFDLAPWNEVTPTTTLTDTRQAWIVPNSDPELVTALTTMFEMTKQRRVHLIIQEASFDLTVALRFAQDVSMGYQFGNRSAGECLYGLIWELLDQSMEDELTGGVPWVHDTIIREKLLNLSTIGGIDEAGGWTLGYGLNDLVKNKFGVSIDKGKVSTDAQGRIYNAAGQDITGTAEAGAAWRLRYCELDGVPLAHWPREAVQYAIDDATWARKVFVVQEQTRAPRGYRSMNSESLQVYAATVLRMMSSVGFPVDREQVERVNARIEAVISTVESNLQVNGIVRGDGSVNQSVLHPRIEAAWAIKQQFPRRTNSGKISADDETLEALEGIDPVLDMYRERVGLSKIKTSFMPNLTGGRVWSNYDILKETGRVSSYGNSDKAKRRPLYPAVNIQQIPRKDGVRECFLPPTGEPTLPCAVPPNWVLCSMDYSALELCSVGQVTYSLFGFSVHREKINAGYDLHSYLGSGMAMPLAPHVVDGTSDHELAYMALRKYAKAKLPDDDDVSEMAELIRKMRKEAGSWRNFAKPTGLGYPGGLGPATLVTFAKATYGVEMTEQQALAFRDLWHAIYPEMKPFFAWVNKQTDTQKPSDGLYVYETQGFNRFRAGASYCATANGKAMQSLSADGAKRATAWMGRACFGGLDKSSPYFLLNGSLLAAFIHDELLTAFPDDVLLTERCLLGSNLMVEAMRKSMPDVKITVEPACMRRWTKAAEAEYVDSPGRGEQVEAAITHLYGGTPPPEWIAQFYEALGPGYNPNRRIIPWDDAHKLKL